MEIWEKQVNKFINKLKVVNVTTMVLWTYYQGTSLWNIKTFESEVIIYALFNTVTQLDEVWENVPFLPY